VKKLYVAVLLAGAMLAFQSYAFTPKNVFFKVNANVPCQEGASTSFPVRVTHEGCLSQEDVDSGEIDVDLVDSDTFSDDELDGSTHSLPGGFMAGDRYRFTTQHELMCTPKDDCEVTGPSGGSGESEAELRVEYGDDTDNFGCATVLCVCGAAPEHLEFVAMLQSGPNSLKTYPGGSLNLVLHVRNGSEPFAEGGVLRSTLISRETGAMVKVHGIEDFVMPGLDPYNDATLCSIDEVPADLDLGHYVLVNELIDAAGNVLEEDFIEIEVASPKELSDSARKAPVEQ
jgi:hypothetical protein